LKEKDDSLVAIAKELVSSTDNITSLKLDKPLRPDSGRYKVIAKNKYGDDCCFITISVFGE